MKFDFQNVTKEFLRKRSRKRLLYNIVAIFGVLTVFCTTYMLVLPALTMEDGKQLPGDGDIAEICGEVNADVESRADWEATFADVDLSGIWAEDALAIARTQLGYEESKENYGVTAEGVTRGYTRYGDWFGDSYGVWDSYFCAFCLSYAGAEVPVEATAAQWAATLASDPEGIFRVPGDYLPKGGDLIFFDEDEEGTADHVGFVAELTEENAGELARVTTVEGGKAGVVRMMSYGLNDSSILGFAEITGATPAGEAMLASENEENEEISGEVSEIETEETETDITSAEEEEIAPPAEDDTDDTEETDKKENKGRSLFGALLGNAKGSPKGGPSEFAIVARASNGKYYAMKNDGTAKQVIYNPSANEINSEESDDILWRKTGNKLQGKGNNNRYVVPGQGGSTTGTTGKDLTIGQSAEKRSVYTVTTSGKTSTVYSLALNSTATAFTSVNSTSAPEPMLFFAALGAPTGGSETSITPDDLVTTADNVWQIYDTGSPTEGRYKGNEAQNKIASSGDPIGNPDNIDDVRIQKNVVPTDTENEFLVYLSMDNRTSIETLLDQSAFWTTTSNSDPQGVYTTSINGNVAAIPPEGVIGGDTEFEILLHIYDKVVLKKVGSGKNAQYVPDENASGTGHELYVYNSVRLSAQIDCSNGSCYLGLPGNTGYPDGRNGIYYGIQHNINFHPAGNGHGNQLEIYIGLDNINFDFPFYNTIFHDVEDALGDEVEFVQMEYSTPGTNPEYDADTHTIRWTDLAEAELPTSTVTHTNNPASLFGWNENVCQLVYRVRLNVEKQGFDSCADKMNSGLSDDETYPVNDSAVLGYYKEPIDDSVAAEYIEGYYGDDSGTEDDPLEAVFPVPYVRGLLYDIDFEKVTNTNEALPQAKFGLYKSDGVTPVMRNGEAYTFTTQNDGKGIFTDLPWGSYVVKELQAPFGYELGTPSQWSVDLCYTDPATRSKVAQSATHPDNMRYKYNGTPWRIVNTRPDTAKNIVMKKLDENGNPLGEAKFALYGDDEGEPAETPIESYADLISGTDGVFFPASSFLPVGSYYLKETEAPEGYDAIEGAIHIVVSESGVTAAMAGGTPLTVTTSGSGTTTTYTVLVPNQMTGGYEMPSTGGNGTALIYALGALIATAALMIGYTQRRRRERRGES